MTNKLRIAWFSKFNISPADREVETLSAYFSEELLPHLRNRFEITLYHNSFKSYENYNTHHYLKAFAHDAEKPFDIFFYQIENDPRLNFARAHLGLIPGITYFHNFNFTNYGPEPLLNSPYQDVVAKFNAIESSWFARDKKYKRSGPAALREAELSPVSIFSSAHSLNEYKSAVTLKLKLDEREALNAFYLPYPVSGEIEKCEPGEAFNLAFAGSVNIENRAHKVLAAISKVDEPIRVHWMVKPEEVGRAEEILREFNVENSELYPAHNSKAWKEILSKCDGAVHTLFSAYSHPEPFLAISLAAGVPSIVTNYGSIEYLPDNVVFKIRPGNTEALEIEGAIKAISHKRHELNREMMRKFAIESHDARQIANELAAIFENRVPYLGEIRKRWRRLEVEAKESLVQEAAGFLENSDKLLEPSFEELGWK